MIDVCFKSGEQIPICLYRNGARVVHIYKQRNVVVTAHSVVIVNIGKNMPTMRYGIKKPYLIWF